jgi:predicted PurR-regulated permease PerM
MPKRVDISHKTIFFIAGFLALIWVVVNIRDLILLIFGAFIIVSAIAPVVERLVKWKLPFAVAIAAVYIVIFLLLAGLIFLGVTPLTTQTSSLILRLSQVLPALSAQFHVDTSSIQSQLPNLSSNIFTFTIGVFQGFITIVLLIVISIYLMLDKTRMENNFAALFGESQKRVELLLDKIEIKLGAWLRGQVILSLIVGLLIYGGLLALGVEFALPLALIAALFEIVPLFGPILAAIPALLIAIITSPFQALLVLILYIVVQQVESHLLVPQVMRRAVGLNPLVVILAITIGNRLLGIPGAFFAVPIAVVCHILVDDYLKGHDDSAIAQALK